MKELKQAAIMAIGNILTYQELMDYADVFDPMDRAVINDGFSFILN